MQNLDYMQNMWGHKRCDVWHGQWYFTFVNAGKALNRRINKDEIVFKKEI